MPWLEAFLGGTASIPTVRPAGLPLRSPLGHRRRGFAYGGSLPAWRACAPGPSPLRHALAQTDGMRDGNVNPLSITCAFRPRLRPASPAVDQHGCGTLGHPVRGIPTPVALLMPTFALPAAPPLPRGGASRQAGTLPYHCPKGQSAASVAGLSPGGLSAPRHGRPVSYYALFQGWLLLSQPPGCLRAATALPT